MHEAEKVQKPAMVHIVDVADMKLTNNAGDRVVTNALGSCIGLAIFDPVAVVGGILHLMLPSSEVNAERAAANPYMFADTGIPSFLRAASSLGAVRERLEITMVGGGQPADTNDFFAIGKRNQDIARMLLSKDHLLIKREHLGGTVSRALSLEIGSGRTWITCAGQEIEL